MMFKTLLFSNFLYICPYKFLSTLSAIFVKIWMKNWNLRCQNYSFYQRNMILVVIFMILEKSLFVSSVLNSKFMSLYNLFQQGRKRFEGRPLWNHNFVHFPNLLIYVTNQHLYSVHTCQKLQTSTRNIHRQRSCTPVG
jgi:hypothetical protein